MDEPTYTCTNPNNQLHYHISSILFIRSCLHPSFVRLPQRSIRFPPRYRYIRAHNHVFVYSAPFSINMNLHEINRGGGEHRVGVSRYRVGVVIHKRTSIGETDILPSLYTYLFTIQMPEYRIVSHRIPAILCARIKGVCVQDMVRLSCERVYARCSDSIRDKIINTPSSSGSKPMLGSMFSGYRLRVLFS